MRVCVCVHAYTRTRLCVMQFVNYCQAYIGVLLAHEINIQEISVV